MVCAVVVVASQVCLAAPVQWTTGTGHNDHWYEVVVLTARDADNKHIGITWDAAQAAAVAKGGYLVTLTSAEENQFVFSLIPSEAWGHPAEFAEGPWLGGSDAASEGNWQWVTGEPWGYANWFRLGVPDNWSAPGTSGGEDYLCFWSVGDPAPTWNDASYPQSNIYSYVVEYEPVGATIDINPDTLNLKSAGKWITCYIELPQGHNVGDIDVSTVKLNGQVLAAAQPTQIGDYDGDGVADLMVKFDRSALGLDVGDAVQMTVTGQLTGGGSFTGSDTIRVISPGKGK